MTEEKQGAVEWLRGIADKYEAEEGIGCMERAKLFGICCDEVGTCQECMTKELRVIVDRIESEWALPEGIEWPRFEDGELVKIGDEVEWDGDVMRVGAVWLHREGWGLSVSCPGLDGTLHGEYGERVKRPVVLDAHGFPIEVGDVVYYDGEPEQLIVDSFDGPGCVCITLAKSPSGMLCTIEPSRLSHERPDSWEQLEEDAYHLVMSEYLETPEKDVSDIVRRAKALAKAGE